MDKVHKTHLLSSSLHLLHLSIFLLSLSAATYVFLRRLHASYQLIPALLPFFQLLVTSKLKLDRGRLHLLDFSCFKPPSRLRVPVAGLLEHLTLINRFDAGSIAFMSKVITSSGIGEESYFPSSLHYIPPSTLYQDSIEEANMLLFPVLRDLFSKTGVSPRDVDALLVNCSGFCPAPSLTSMVVHEFRMREDVKTYNLSGMGCSAGVIGVDAARSILKSGNHSYAVVLSTEIVSTGWYHGKDRRKLLLNCLFRLGSSAVLLTNERRQRRRAKYELVQLVRTQRAFDDRAYRSAGREEDAEGITGFSIERDLLTVAAETLRDNLMALGMSMLPLREKLRYVAVHVANRLGSKAKKKSESASSGYVPDFGVQHYCVPSSGKAVIREIGKGLGLGERDVEAAMMTFHRFGNQSSASMWYQLAYTEAKGRVRGGDMVWQLGAGSGPKCNTLVWRCVKDLAWKQGTGPWGDCIERYPVKCELN